MNCKKQILKTIDVVLIGRITIDFNPLDYYNDLANCFSFQKYLGGSTGNTAIGLNRLKNKVYLINKISNDQFGKTILNFFKQEKLSTKYLMIDPIHQTGLTFTQMLSFNESSILMYRENTADLNLLSKEIPVNLISQAKLLVISGTALAQSPSREACLKAILIAKQNNTKIVFDIDFRNYTWKNQEEVSIYYQLVANYADLIIGSYEEFLLTSHFLNLNIDLNNKDLSMKVLAKHWLKTTALIIIKDGKNGSNLFTKDIAYHVDIIAVKMLKSFGGGDAYAAYFLHFYLKNEKDLLTALMYATAAASYMVQNHSSFDHPKLNVLTTWLKKQTKNNPSSLVKQIKDWKF